MSNNTNTNTADRRRIGLRLGAAGGTVTVAAALTIGLTAMTGGTGLLTALGTRLLSAGADDPSAAVAIMANGGPTDYANTPILGGLLTDSSQLQDYANFASIPPSGPWTLLTPGNVSDFPPLTSADIGSETLTQNLYSIPGLTGWGYESNDITAATGALAANHGDSAGEIVTPFGPLKLFGDLNTGTPPTVPFPPAATAAPAAADGPLIDTDPTAGTTYEPGEVSPPLVTDNFLNWYYTATQPFAMYETLPDGTTEVATGAHAGSFTAAEDFLSFGGGYGLEYADVTDATGSLAGDEGDVSEYILTPNNYAIPLMEGPVLPDFSFFQLPV